MTETTDHWLDEHNVDREELTHWANVVLGWDGARPWWQPSTWELALIRLLSVSDSDNLRLLFEAFPAATAAWIIWRERDRFELERLADLR